MPTQTGSLDLSSLKVAYDDASTKATSYITELTNGVLVHPEDNDSTGWRIQDALELLVDNQSLIYAGATGATGAVGAIVRIGSEDDMHVTMTPSELAFRDGSGTSVAYIEVVGGESLFYMTRAVVVSDLRFGKSQAGSEGLWKFETRDNENLSLKWLGATGATGATGSTGVE